MKSTELELAQKGIEKHRAAPTPAEMMQAMIDHGITRENVTAFTELVKLSEHIEDRNAKREFASAFVKLQEDLPTIPGCRQVPDKQGKIKFAYANFEDIDAIVRPICLKHGFTYAFREVPSEPGKYTTVMDLQHSGGHCREIPYTVRVGSGPYGSTESQADVAAHSYAQRGAIESGLSLRIIGQREDARMEGGPITKEQADSLRDRVRATGSSEEFFLKFAGAKTYEEIAESKYAVLDANLRKKESTK